MSDSIPAGTEIAADDPEFQNLETEIPQQEYVDLDPNDPEIIAARAAAGDESVPVAAVPHAEIAEPTA